jgi:PAS domain S-box-containing protein
MNIDHLAQALVATEADAILAVDRSGLIRFWNPGAHRIFGFTDEEAVGQSLDLIIPNTLRARHNAGFEQVMASGKTRYGSGDLLAVPALAKDGRRISVEFTIVLLRDSFGATSGAAAIMRDVTARFEETRALRREIAALKAAGSEHATK